MRWARPPEYRGGECTVAASGSHCHARLFRDMTVFRTQSKVRNSKPLVPEAHHQGDYISHSLRHLPMLTAPTQLLDIFSGQPRWTAVGSIAAILGVLVRYSKAERQRERASSLQRVFSSLRRADASHSQATGRDLRKLRFRVWWDREAMESRGGTFLQESVTQSPD